MLTTNVMLLCLSFILILFKAEHSLSVLETNNNNEIIDNIHHNKVLEKFRNKEIIFMGDSLTRYQYLNFIGFLHTAQWVSRPPHIESERAWATIDGDWVQFMKLSNLRFGGYEICDCHRDTHNPIPIEYTQEQSDENWIPGVKENRHYYDPNYNITVRCFFFTGFPFLMSTIPNVTDFLNMDNSLDQWLFNRYNPTYEYRYDHIDDFLTTHIKPRNPDILFINMGFWSKSPGLRDMNLNPKHFAESLKAVVRIPIWKTTTASVCDVPCLESESISEIDSPNAQQVFKNEKIAIFDAFKISKPFRFDKANYDDSRHFKPHVYAVLNKHLIVLLESLL